MQHRLVSVLIGLLIFPLALCAQETAKIGELTLKIPPPAGFARLDGVNKEIDALVLHLVPPEKRMLMAMAKLSEVAKVKDGSPPDLSRSMTVQTPLMAEDQKVTQEQFEELYKSAQARDQAGGKLGEDIEAKVNKILEKAKVPGSVKIGEMVLLGVGAKTVRSFNISTLMQMKTEGEETRPVVSVVSVLLIRGKLVYLYVSAVTKGGEDVAWARGTAIAWRDAVLAANPE